MDLTEVGALLKKERERRGISIRDVMDATKISRRNLTALEEGQVKLLPHPVYLKGYVRNIARLVGLDADELAQVVDRQFDQEQSAYLAQAAAAPRQAEPEVASLRSAASPEPPRAPAPPQHQASPQHQAPSHKATAKARPSTSWRSILVLLLLVGALGGLLVQYQRIVNETLPEPPVAEAPASNATNTANATAPDAATGPAALDNSTAEAALQEPAASLPPVAPPSLEPQRATPAAPTAQSVLAVPTAPVPAASIEVSRKATASGPADEPRAPGTQVLTFSAKGRDSVWVGVYEGDKATIFTLREGDSRQVSFSKRARVRLGNAGGVAVRLNGQDYPFEGERGQKATLEFGTR